MMRQRATHIICLFFLAAFAARIAAAELTVTTQWRIEQASETCTESGNALTFPDYWGEGVTDENHETVCIAEQFALLLKDDGQGWLDNASAIFIDTCKEAGGDDDVKYYQCLQKGLKKITKQVSAPCQELGEEGLWDEDLCRQLVSYVFIDDFQQVMEAHRPVLEKLAERETLHVIFGPIAAVIAMLLYVLDVVIWTDPGNWWRIPKFGSLVGALILGAWFLSSPWNLLGTAAAVCICVGGMVRNHILDAISPKRKKKISIFNES